MTKFFRYLFIVILFGCGQSTTSSNNADRKLVANQDPGKRFFIYDSIIHYHSNFHDSSLPDLNPRKYESIFDSLKREVILGDIPTDITDLRFLGKLEHMGYQKRNVDKSLFKSLDSIFIEKSAGERYYTLCPAIYRDIIVFKKTAEIVGIAKICFSCGHYRIVGTDANTDNFGINDDYNKLANILK